jgi:hypothetical protein
MNSIGKPLLIIGAGVNFAIALLHLVIIVIGTPAYLYFGAAGLAEMAAQGSFIPALATFCLAGVFAGFGVYALSGAGILRPLPLVKLGLVVIGGIYSLRGLIVMLDIFRLVRGDGYPLRQTVFSAAALGIGLVYLVGVAAQRRASARQNQTAGQAGENREPHRDRTGNGLVRSE